MPEQSIHSTYTDTLSPLGREILALDSKNAYNGLVVNGLGNPTARELLENAHAPALFVSKITSAEDANAALAGLWLWHDWLDFSHRISQDNPTATGSFWHAIMHRREGDFSNSKYWYARCRNHPVLPSLARQASSVVDMLPANKPYLRLTQSGWDGDVFVDIVQEASSQPQSDAARTAIALQQLEWRALFDHCVRSATA